MIRPCVVGEGEYPTVTGGPFADGYTASVTSLYGPREPIQTPAGMTGDFHYGIDLFAHDPPPLVSLMDGVVEYAEAWNPTVGNWIRVRSGEWSFDYYHMDAPPIHKPGDVVGMGEYVGNVGTTGLSTAPHLHLGMTLNGAPIDPLPVLRDAKEDEVRKVTNTEAVNALMAVVEQKDDAIAQREGCWVGVKEDGEYREITFRVKGEA